MTTNNMLWLQNTGCAEMACILLLSLLISPCIASVMVCGGVHWNWILRGSLLPVEGFFLHFTAFLIP